MPHSMVTVLASAAVGSGLVLSQASPAAAQTPLPSAAALQLADKAPLVSYARYGSWHSYGHPSYGRWYDGRYPWRGSGPAVAAGIAGLATGAIIGGAIASQQAAPAYPVAPSADPNWLTYCSQRYRSFDPATGTYLGYDGQRRVCYAP
jgi:hypothetical protein